MRPLRYSAALLALALLTPLPANAAISYLGKGALPYSATDFSGLTNVFPDGTPHNLLGGLGSGITYSGFGNRYYVTPDRGPGGGTVDYFDRFHTVDVQISDTGSGFIIVPTLINTKLMRNAAGQNFTGFSGTIGVPYTADHTLRFDPEGVALDRSGLSIYVSDEYGPYIRQFRLSDGALLRTIPVPAKFGIANPNADGNLELPPANTSGRQSNRGMEGLTISPDGSKLFGIMQNALIQDGALNATNGRIGLNNRILEIDLATEQTKEYVYPLAAANLGVNELLAVNDHQFLVIERDGRGLGAGNTAQVKNLYLADISGATDVSSIVSLPTSGLPVGVAAASKTLFLNLLTSTGIPGAQFPEKIEGIAFGPDLSDGRHTLIVTNDNDFFGVSTPLVDNNFYVFAFPPSDLPGFQRQQIDFVPVPTLVELFRAIDTPEGVRIEWRTTDASVAGTQVFRASDPQGEWSTVHARATRDGLNQVIVDREAEVGTAQWYRLEMSLRNGGTFTSEALKVQVTGGATAFAMSPLSPNPTRGAGILSFSVPKSAPVRISIVDLQGRTVSVLSDGIREAGRYTEALDASDLPAGLYFVRMQSKDAELRQRIVIVK